MAAAPEQWRIRPALDGMGPAGESGGTLDMLKRAFRRHCLETTV